MGVIRRTNGLLRQYFPKGTDLSVHSQAYLNKVARQLNERLSWSRLSEQNLRVDKWRPLPGYAAIRMGDGLK